MTEGPVLFSVERVSKRHGSGLALDNVSLRFEPGSVTALIGSSGAGKSTLLRMLIGLDWPDAGQVTVDGQPLQPDGRMALRRRVGYVTQDGGLFPHLSARDNLALLPRHLGWNAARIDTRAQELAERMQLPQDLLRRFPAELSGGQRQRVAVMRALMTDPAALLLDEPLGALDPVVRFDLQEQLRQVFADVASTVVLVTHDLPEAAFLASRLVLLHQGAVIQDSSPEELFAHPANDFARRFINAHRDLPQVRP
ncbi:ATP-binding cassette domain-containing protein [Nevskia soli]|uniref:ATP-binding cassette domain-containing protein n=1 Tax=Nevskia soli TaxID=418856 RepID=UPI0004A7790A|nr:ATP-binding cassette domain-containing protein [Nevskia soli]